jgi:hypothetical protein
MALPTILERFKYIEPNPTNLDNIVATNRRLYFYRNSDIKTPANINDLEIEEGILKSEITHSNIKEGFQLNLEDFINDELAELKKIDVAKLSFGELKKYRIYLDFLTKKLSNVNYTSVTSHNYYLADLYKLEEFRKAIWSGYFKDIIVKKKKTEGGIDLHYSSVLKSWLEHRNKQVEENSFLKSRKDLLKGYNRTLHNLAAEIIEFLTIVNNFNYVESSAQFNSFNFKMFDIEMSLKSIEEFAQIFNHNINTGHYKTALHIQHYCLLMYDNIISILGDRLFVRVYNSPMNGDFLRTRNALKDAVNLDKLKLMVQIKDDVIEDSKTASKTLSNTSFLEFNKPLKKQTPSSLNYDDEMMGN